MSTDTTVSPLRQRMIEDMAARKLGRHAQRSHIHSCRRFAAFLGRSPDTATADDVPPLPAAPGRERTEYLQSQPDHDGGEVSVPRHAAAARSRREVFARDRARKVDRQPRNLVLN